MSDLDLGTARGRIEIDASGVEYGVGRAQQSVDGLTRSTQVSSEQMARTGAVMVGGAAAIAAGFGVAINAAADFETKISGIQAVSGATSAQLEIIRQKALQLGADTAFSASDAAGAMEELIKAGLTVDDVLNGAADATVNLAAAGQIDLPQAATIAANAMNQFGLAAGDLPHVADLIAGAANASAIDVGQFAEAMQQSGAVANLVGLSFDDLSVAIAAMGNAGIKGSDAGTSLKTFLSNLIPTTQQQTNLMRQLGIVTEDGSNRFFDAAGNIKSMADISEVLRTALAGMTAEQQQATLQTMFGSDAIRAAAVIAGEGADGFNELAGAMSQVSAADVAATRMDNLNGSIEQLKGSFETLLIMIGRPLADSLRGFIDLLTGAINWVSSLDQTTLNWIVTIGKIVGVILGAVGAMLLISSAGGKVKEAIAAINFVMEANPILAVVAALVALGYIFYQLYQNSETFRNAVDALFGRIRDFAMPIIEQIRLGFHALIAAFNDPDVTSNGFVGFMERIGVAARQTWDFIQGTIIPGLHAFWAALSGEGMTGNDGFIGFMERAGQTVRDFAITVDGLVERVGGWRTVFIALAAAIGLITAPWTTIAAGLVLAYTKFQPFRDIVDSTVDVLQAIGEKILWLAGEVIERLVSGFDWFHDHVWPVITAFADLVWAVVERVGQAIGILIEIIQHLQPVFDAVFSYIMFVVRSFVDAVQIIWRNFGDNIWHVIEFAFNLIKSIVEDVLDVIQGIIQVVTGLIKGDWGEAWDGIKNIFDGAWHFIRDLPGQVLDAIKLIIQSGLDVITSAFQIMVSVVQNAWNTFWNFLKGVAGDSIDGVISFVQAIPGRIFGALGDFGHLLWSVGTGIIGGLLGGITEAVGDVLRYLVGLPDRILHAVGDLGHLLYDIGRDIIQGLIDGIQSMIAGLGHVLGGIGGFISDHKGPPEKDATLLVPAGRLIIQGLITGIESQLGSLGTSLASIAGMIGAGVGASAAVPTSTTSNSSFVIQLNFPNVRSADRETLAEALNDPSMLAALNRAVRQGVGANV